MEAFDYTDIYLRLRTEVRGYTSCVGLFFGLLLQGVENVKSNHFIFWVVTDKILRPIFWQYYLGC